MTRTYVVTGSASGIGAAATRLLRERAAQVIGVDRYDAEVEADLSNGHGRSAAALRATDLAGGVVDGVIACAGLATPAPVTVAVNYFGVVDFLDALRPALAASDAPRAVVTASLATFQPNSPELVDACVMHDEERALEIGAALAAAGPQVGMLNYTSSKRALSQWIRSASIRPEWAGAGIALNAVAPGTVETPMMTEMLATPELVAMVDAHAPMPLNYHQSPETVAHLLLWLTGVENTHVTGQTIPIDGGAETVLRGGDVWSWDDAHVAAMLSSH